MSSENVLAMNKTIISFCNQQQFIILVESICDNNFKQKLVKYKSAPLNELNYLVSITFNNSTQQTSIYSDDKRKTKWTPTIPKQYCFKSFTYHQHFFSWFCIAFFHCFRKKLPMCFFPLFEASL